MFSCFLMMSWKSFMEQNKHIYIYTLPKTNMEPKNGGLLKIVFIVFLFQGVIFLRFHVSFRGCMYEQHIGSIWEFNASSETSREITTSLFVRPLKTKRTVRCLICGVDHCCAGRPYQFAAGFCPSITSQF